jgi:L-threonylcarbamoyladenylate synthase
VTRVLQVRPEAIAAEPLREAAAVLARGGLVAIPTETVYGLAANALDPHAVQRIFEAKGRPSYNPLIVHVADAAQARALAARWPEAAERLARRFWPGPLTIVVPKAAAVPDLVTAGLDTVALRVPGHPVALELLRLARLPVAAPSANRFTRLSPTLAEHVVAGLGDRIDLILDAGPTGVGIESTVIDLSGPLPVLLRPGSITREELQREIGPVALPIAGPAETAPRASPGMLDRHYAPKARVRLVDTREELLRSQDEAARQGLATGALLLGPPEPHVEHGVAMPADPAAYAAALYATLHRLDALGCDVVFVERPPAGEGWAGIADRLRRATS